MMEPLRFHWSDPTAREHFKEHGYVVVSGVLSDVERETIASGWRDIVAEAALRVDMTTDDFVERFPQNRDLWRKSGAFRQLLFETSQAAAARLFLGVSGVRLFHDHAISKPSGRSGTIPWHQDSAYWPLDRVGLSLWTPVEDVPEHGGCLKVLAASHRDGPGEPQDFLAGRGADRDDDPRLVRLPVRRGETVILNGLSWHGSDPNTSAVERLAYLTLWVPATARFVAEHAAWHPTAARIGVAPGARLDGDWFPLFGHVPVEDEGDPVAFPLPNRGSGPSMFTAGKDIAAQIAWLQGRDEGGILVLLADDGIDTTVALAIGAGFVAADQEPNLRQVLRDLVLQERVRRESVARDVYLGTVSRWWRLIGAQIAEVWHAE